MEMNSPWSKPARAASTISSAFITIPLGRCATGTPVMSQKSVEMLMIVPRPRATNPGAAA